MIVVTGAAGFIGSCFVNKLNNKGHKDIVVVDDFSRSDKNRNLDNKVFEHKVDRELFFEWLDNNHHNVNFVVHIGARTDTTEFDVNIFNKLNLNYSKMMWEKCADYNLPLIYASSAATYGAGENGYLDSHEIIPSLKPLNPYGESKNDFDKWVLLQGKKPPLWAGLKFFNVYGPNEYHKGRMASVVFHAYHQIKKTGEMKLFKSHKPEFNDGEQLRDFVYVKDVVSVLYFIMMQKQFTGIYNLGTGKARSFVDLAKSVFSALYVNPSIGFIDTPEDIRDKYQYFTEANMEKLKSVGYDFPFFSLEDGIKDYVQGYLNEGLYL
jgi:ADP-L-glycero-D-manno-heptose 6-epimerase